MIDIDVPDLLGDTDSAPKDEPVSPPEPNRETPTDRVPRLEHIYDLAADGDAGFEAVWQDGHRAGRASRGDEVVALHDQIIDATHERDRLREALLGLVTTNPDSLCWHPALDRARAALKGEP